MPKIDPITDCRVMTLPEFFEHEAAAEGKGRSAAELMTETFAEIGREMDSDAEEMRRTLERDALEIIRKYLAGFEGGVDEEGKPLPSPQRIVRIQAQASVNFSGSGGSFTALAECADGRLRYFHWSHESWSGDFYEPPGEEEELLWGEAA